MKNKVLLIHNRSLPIFNKKNQGAIEKLERIYLKHNEDGYYRFTVYSPKIARDDFDSKKVNNVTFRNIDLTTKKSILLRFCYSMKRRLFKKGNNEYYIREVIKDIKQRKEENEYDLIIFENEEGSIPLFCKKTNTKTRIALHLHNDYVNIDRKYSKNILDYCDEVWCVSKFIEAQVKEVNSNIKTIIVPNTTEKLPLANDKVVARLRDRYKPERNIIFLFIGRLIESKGIRELVDAFNIFNLKNENAKLIIIGAFGGGWKNKQFAKQVRARVAKNQNIDLVGYKGIGEIANYYKVANVQVIPSKWNEAFGLVTIEAMQGNVRIIASDNAAFREICNDKAIYVSKSDLVKELVDAMRNTSDLPKISREYYSDIVRKYSIKNYCLAIDNAIARAIETGGVIR